jgi:hypothetical protein
VVVVGAAGSGGAADNKASGQGHPSMSAMLAFVTLCRLKTDDNDVIL